MIYNLTPHSIDIFPRADFVNLEEGKVFLADGVFPDAKGHSFPSNGIARVTTAVFAVEDGRFPFPMFSTKWGELEGLPESVDDEDLLIVSPIFQSAAFKKAHPWADQMVCPHGAVRLRSNTSQILGCLGLTY